MSGCSGGCGGCPSSKTCGSAQNDKVVPQVAKTGKIIAVGSGKGGVGKSTVTALCAVACAKAGLKVGVLDADITGPSIPKILGVERHPLRGDNGRILPAQTAGGIKVMSLSLVMDDNSQPVVWRGPMISGILKQFWEDVDWSDLDVLFIDLPPGTADAPLTVLQTMCVSGLLSVTTPQSLSATIVQKQANMAKMLNVPLLGLVENMSYLDVNGQRVEPFGPSHLEEVEQALDLSQSIRLPIDPQLCKAADNGQLEHYDHTELFKQLVSKVLGRQ